EETLLRKLADWRPPQSERQTLTVSEKERGWTISITADRHDELSSSLWELDLRRPALPSGQQALSDWAQQVAERVTGLREPLRVVEVDPLRNEALLRSNEPTQRNEDLFYYELRLRGTAEALLQRYRGSHQKGKREQIPFALTHEAAAKLVVDVIAD